MRIKSVVQFVKRECMSDEAIDWDSSMESRCGETVTEVMKLSDNKVKCTFSDGDWYYYTPACLEEDATTLASANTDAQVMANAAQSSSESYASTTAQADANAAQSNSEAYTSQSYQQANVNAKGYAQQAQSNAETFAQGAANQAQINSEQYAASGIAAALAMPSSPYLRPGHYAVGIQAATYGGEQGFGARATFQMSNHWSANAGVAGGTGIYGQVGGAVGVQYEG